MSGISSSNQSPRSSSSDQSPRNSSSDQSPRNSSSDQSPRNSPSDQSPRSSSSDQSSSLDIHHENEPDRQEEKPPFNPRGYRVGGKIADGGFSSPGIWECTKGVWFFVKHRAVKPFRPEREEDFRRESEITRLVCHPLTVKVYETHQSDKTIWMRRYRTSLASFIDHQRDSKSYRLAATKYLISAAYGLAFVHSKGVIHRDIKDGNIFCWERNRAVIGDFGFATLRNGDKNLAGTDGYMAPEVKAHLGASTKSDVWSFGITIYRVFTGRLPWNGPPPKGGGSSLQLPDNFPPVWFHIFKRCTEEGPRQRMTMEEVCSFVSMYAPAQRLADVPREIRSMCNSDDDFIPTFDGDHSVDLRLFIDEIKSLDNLSEKTLSKKKESDRPRRRATLDSSQIPNPWDYFRSYGGAVILLLVTYFSLSMVPVALKIGFDDFFLGYFYGTIKKDMAAFNVFVLYLSHVLIAIYLLVGMKRDVKAEGPHVLWESSIWAYVDLLIFAVVEIICCVCREYPHVVGVSSSVELVVDLILVCNFLTKVERKRHLDLCAMGLAFWVWGRTIIAWRLLSCIQWNGGMYRPFQQALGITLTTIVVLFTIISKNHWLSWIRLTFHGILTIIYFCSPAYTNDYALLISNGFCHLAAAVAAIPPLDKFIKTGAFEVSESCGSYKTFPRMTWLMVAANLVCVLAIIIPILVLYYPSDLPSVTQNAGLEGFNDWKRYGLAILSGFGYFAFGLGVICFFKAPWRAKMLDLMGSDDPVRRRQVISSRILLGCLLIIGYGIFLAGFHLIIMNSDYVIRSAISGVAIQVFCHYTFEITRRIIINPFLHGEMGKSKWLDYMKWDIPAIVIQGVCSLFVFAFIVGLKTISVNATLMFFHALWCWGVSTFVSIWVRRFSDGESEICDTIAAFCWNLLFATLPCALWILSLSVVWPAVAFGVFLMIKKLHALIAKKMRDSYSSSSRETHTTD